MALTTKQISSPRVGLQETKWSGQSSHPPQPASCPTPTGTGWQQLQAEQLTAGQAGCSHNQLSQDIQRDPAASLLSNTLSQKRTFAEMLGGLVQGFLSEQQARWPTPNLLAFLQMCACATAWRPCCLPGLGLSHKGITRVWRRIIYSHITQYIHLDHEALLALLQQ